MKNLNFCVDKSKCVKCGLCVKDCLCGAVSFGEDGYPKADESRCFGCQHCFAICPKGAISVFGNSPDEAFNKTALPTSDELENLIKMRRSCRHFKDENVEQEKLDKLKEVLNWVPTGCNDRGLHFAIVENKDSMQIIREDLMTELQDLAKNDKLTGMLANFKDTILSGEDVVFRNAPHMIVVSVDKNAHCKNIDPTIALSYFEIFAQSLGISTLWCGFATWTIPLCKKVYDKLNLPENYEIAYVMMFGKSDVKYARSITPEPFPTTII